MNFAEEQDKDAIVNPYLFIGESNILLLSMAVEEAGQNMPDSVRQVLIDHGCINEDEPENQ